MIISRFSLVIPLILFFLVSSVCSLHTEELREMPLPLLQEQITREHDSLYPREWGMTVRGVRTRLKTTEKVIALTFDACGGKNGNGFDAVLIDFLEQQRIPATLFVSGRWIDANLENFNRLAANPIFEIANHGLSHRTASVTGQSAYGISGTRSVGALVNEIEANARKIKSLTGKRTRFYRSGTAYYDDVAIRIAHSLEHEVVGFSILGDAGGTYDKDQVMSALLVASPGDIAILHMNHPKSEIAAGVIGAISELKKRGYRFVTLSEYSLE